MKYRKQQSDSGEREPTAPSPLADPWKSRPGESPPPSLKFPLREPPPSENMAPAADRGDDSQRADIPPEEQDEAALTGTTLRSELLALASSFARHHEKNAMFGAVTRGLIRVERRKTLRRRILWRLAMTLFISGVAGAGYAVWHNQPDWAMPWWPADWWPGDLFSPWW
ncbi:MAG: hypothetical protein IIA67_09030 [Planctomycetes bacterium]|nr:hypothetical protein [Planctomycetota bacterium]